MSSGKGPTKVKSEDGTPPPAAPKKVAAKPAPKKKAPPAKSAVEVEEEKERDQRKSLLKSHKDVKPILKKLKEMENGPLTLSDVDIAAVEEAIARLENFNDYDATREQFPKDPIRVVLIGDQGQGKSFVANYILDDAADPLEGPFQSKRAQDAVTSVPMSAKYGETKQIRAVFEHKSSTSDWFDWDSDIAPLLEEDMSPLEAIKHRLTEGQSQVNVQRLEINWPSTLLRRYNLEVIDMPGFDPSDARPKEILQRFLADERDLAVEDRAVLMVFAPSNERNKVEPSSSVHLAVLQECGLFSVASVAELPPIVFVRNNTNSLNEDPEAPKRFAESIPHIRKIVYSAFDVRDRESETYSNVDYKALQVPGPHPSLTSLAAASQIADHLGDQLADNYHCWHVRTSEKLSELLEKSSFGLIVRYLRAKRRSQFAQNVAQTWLNKLMLPVKLAALCVSRAPFDALGNLKEKVDKKMKSLETLSRKMRKGNSFWSPVIESWIQRMEEAPLADPHTGSLIPLNDQECELVASRFMSELKGVIEGEAIERSAELECLNVLDECATLVRTKFATGSLGNKKKEYIPILQELAEALLQHIQAQRECVFDLKGEAPKISLTQEIDTALNLKQDQVEMYAAIHEASKEARIGHIDKTTDISELMTAESISTIILQMTTKLLAAVEAHGPISDYVKSGKGVWYKGLARDLDNVGQKIGDKLENFGKLAIPGSYFFEARGGNKVGAAAQVAAAKDTGVGKDFLKCKKIESAVKKLEKATYGTKPTLTTLPKVEFKTNHKSHIINAFQKRSKSSVAKPSLFHRLAKVTFVLDDEITKLSTPLSEKLERPPAHIITAEVTLGNSSKLTIRIPTKASVYLKDRYSVSQNSAPLSPLLFASKLLPRKDTSSSIVQPRFHLDDLQKTHPNTVQFIVVCSSQLASYATLLDQWLWRPDYPQERIAVFLVSVLGDFKDFSNGWMNSGRCWEIGKLLLEHLNFCDRYFIMSDRYERFGFWTNFRSWRPVAPGPALELIEKTMSYEQSSATIFTNFKAFVEDLSSGTFAPDKPDDAIFKAHRREITKPGTDRWSDVVWNRNDCESKNRGLLNDILWTSHSLQEFLRQHSREASEALDSLMRSSKDRVAMIGLEDSVGVIGGDGVVRSKMALGGLISHRACLGAYKSPLVNLRACSCVDLVGPLDFFQPPMKREDLKALFSHNSRSTRQTPDESWGEVFPTPQKKSLAALGFSGTLKKFAADLWLNGHLSFRHVLVSSSSVFKTNHNDAKNFDFLHWSTAQASKLDALRAHSVSSSAAGVRWPKAQLNISYYSDGINLYTDEKSNIENEVLQLGDLIMLWNLEPQNVLPDSNSLFHALSAQAHGYDDVDTATGEAQNSNMLRLRAQDWISTNPRVDLSGKTVSELINQESGATSPDDYLKRVAESGVYIGGQLILHAASRMLGRPIFVFRTDYSQPIEFSSVDSSGKQPILLGLIVSEDKEMGHFFSLRPKDPGEWVIGVDDSVSDSDNDEDRMDDAPVADDDEHEEVDAEEDEEPKQKKANDKKVKKNPYDEKKKRKRGSDLATGEKKKPTKKKKDN